MAVHSPRVWHAGCPSPEGPPSLTIERTLLYMQNLTLEETIPVEVIGPITCQTQKSLGA